MSNIGKQPVTIKDGVQVAVEAGKVTVTGTKGTLETQIPRGVVVTVEDGSVLVKKEKDIKEFEKFYGLTRAMIANMVEGVSKGFEKKLELSGVGYRARVEGRDLVLSIGFANQVKITPPQEVQITVADNVITVSGIDKQLVGNIASKIHEVRPPDPYKAKGVRYVGEKIRRKPGKSAKA